MNSVIAGERLAIPELESYREQFQENRNEARRLTEELSDEQMNWRPAAGRWSIAECFAHLDLIGRLYRPVLTTVIDKARKDNRLARGPFRLGFIGRKFIGSMEPPPKLKVRTVASMLPGGLSAHNADAVMDEFYVLGDTFTALMKSAEGLDLRRVRVRSVVTPLLRLGIGEWFAFLAAHERRHIWQARQVLNAPGFPDA
jgi:hypothetical protein